METAITFLLGVLTGVLGQYLGTRFADKAKNKDERNDRIKRFEKTKELMSSLLKEMYDDFSNSTKREFFVIDSKTILFNGRDYVAYYRDEHSELNSKIRFLLDSDFITDITETTTPKYFVREEFIDFMKREYGS